LRGRGTFSMIWWWLERRREDAGTGTMEMFEELYLRMKAKESLADRVIYGLAGLV
jgi:hypothetical protein